MKTAGQEDWSSISHWLKVISLWTLWSSVIGGILLAATIILLNRLPGLFFSAWPRFLPNGEAAKVLTQKEALFFPKNPGSGKSSVLKESELSKLLTAWADEAMSQVLTIRSSALPLKNLRPNTFPDAIGWLAPFDKRGTRKLLYESFRKAGLPGIVKDCKLLKEQADDAQHTAQDIEGGTYKWWWHNGSGKEVAAMVMDEAWRICLRGKKILAKNRSRILRTYGKTCPQVFANAAQKLGKTSPVLKDPFGQSWKCLGENAFYGKWINGKDDRGHFRRDQIVLLFEAP